MESEFSPSNNSVFNWISSYLRYGLQHALRLPDARLLSVQQRLDHVQRGRHGGRGRPGRRSGHHVHRRIILSVVVHAILDELVRGEVYRLVRQVHGQLRVVGSVERTHALLLVDRLHALDHGAVLRVVHLQPLLDHLRRIRYAIVDEGRHHRGTCWKQRGAGLILVRRFGWE